MRATKAGWGAEESLADLTFYVDWDPVASMILSLRIHLYEYATIPSWNYMLCHGRPELSVPYSWAWTWPSLFAYTFPPVFAILAVWIVMTLVGFLSTRALLLRWTGSQVGALLGACVYVLSGHFAARFNAGHLTFAFYHWIPLLIFLFDVACDRARGGGAMLWPLLSITAVAFLFVSGGLPHPLLHFSPVLLLFILYRVLRDVRAIGLRPALHAAWKPIVANALGIALAAYKLWPVIAWQLAYPRTRIRFESYEVVQVILNTLMFVTDYLPTAKLAPWHAYPPWGYNAFVGPVPWLCALVALGAGLSRWVARVGRGPADRASADRVPDPHGVALFGAILVLVGIALSLGNDNPLSPAYLFRHLPVLDGIRAFNRYQIFIVFGLAILSARGAVILGVWTRRSPPVQRALWIVVFVAALAPLLVQAVLLVRNIPAASNARIVARLELDEPSGPPELVGAKKGKTRHVGHQTAILDHGNWVGRCHANITLPRSFPRRFRRVESLTDPPPVSVEGLGHDSITLRYAAEESGPIRLHLRTLEWFSLDVPGRWEEGWLVVESRDLDDDRFTLTSSYPAVAQGCVASGAGLVVAVVFFGAVARGERAGGAGGEAARA